MKERVCKNCYRSKNITIKDGCLTCGFTLLEGKWGFVRILGYAMTGGIFEIKHHLRGGRILLQIIKW